MKSSRRRSREFALQGLYQWQLAGTDPETIAQQLSDAEGFAKIDTAYFKLLLDGAVAGAVEMEQRIAPLLDRAYKSLSPVERGILLLAGFEFEKCPEVPYRVVINEAIELAKSFGGTDGHKYVNGVLDKMAVQLRAPEVQAGRNG
jgi:N utilization substance protein B